LLDTPPQPTRLADYRPPDFLNRQRRARIRSRRHRHPVKSHLALRRNPAAAETGAPLRLDGDELGLVTISLDGEPLAPSDTASKRMAL